MKPSHDTTSSAIQASDLVHWHEQLRLLPQRLRPSFARPEPFQRTLHFLEALLSEVPRKNGGSYTGLVSEFYEYDKKERISVFSDSSMGTLTLPFIKKGSGLNLFVSFTNIAHQTYV